MYFRKFFLAAFPKLNQRGLDGKLGKQYEERWCKGILLSLSTNTTPIGENTTLHVSSKKHRIEQGHRIWGRGVTALYQELLTLGLYVLVFYVLLNFLGRGYLSSKCMVCLGCWLVWPANFSCCSAAINEYFLFHQSLAVLATPCVLLSALFLPIKSQR